MANKVPEGQGKPLAINHNFSKDAHLLHDDKFVTEQVTIYLRENGDMVDHVFFVANRPMRVVGVSERHSTKGSDGSAVTCQLEKVPGGVAAGSGYELLSTALDMKTDNNSVQTGSLVTEQSTLTLGVGDGLGLDFGGTLTALAGLTLTVDLIPA